MSVRPLLAVARLLPMLPLCVEVLPGCEGCAELAYPVLGQGARLTEEKVRL